MNLLLDLGNSRLKWACADIGNQPIELQQGGKSDYADGIEKLLESLPFLNEITQVWLASVAHAETTEAVHTWASKRQLSIYPVHTGMPNMPILHCYSRPQDLGVDRWLAMVAATAKSEGWVGVIDAGSAITVDVVDSNARHLGGVIMPGLCLLSTTLRSGTALDWQERGAELALADETSSAINNGVLIAAVASIDKAISIAQESANLSSSAGQWLITGGDAAVIAESLKCPVQHRPDLVLQGLAEVAARSGQSEGQSPRTALQPETRS